uniref:Uncharacterized protein n=1 Tax=Parascaris univalens TaxID=6257 RepID=A0A915BRJ3_PARUN
MDDDIVDFFVVIVVVVVGLLGLAYLAFRAYAEQLRSCICCCQPQKRCHEGTSDMPAIPRVRVEKTTCLNSSKLKATSPAFSTMARQNTQRVNSRPPLCLKASARVSPHGKDVQPYSHDAMKRILAKNALAELTSPTQAAQLNLADTSVCLHINTSVKRHRSL